MPNRNKGNKNKTILDSPTLLQCDTSFSVLTLLNKYLHIITIPEAVFLSKIHYSILYQRSKDNDSKLSLHKGMYYIYYFWLSMYKMNIKGNFDF